jgi:hypothetical protein
MEYLARIAVYGNKRVSLLGAYTNIATHACTTYASLRQYIFHTYEQNIRAYIYKLGEEALGRNVDLGLQF